MCEYYKHLRRTIENASKEHSASIGFGADQQHDESPNNPPTIGKISGLHHDYRFLNSTTRSMEIAQFLNYGGIAQTVMVDPETGEDLWEKGISEIIVPARPFMTEWMKSNVRTLIKRKALDDIVSNEGVIDLKSICKLMHNAVIKQVANGSRFKSNGRDTIDRKGRNAPLWDGGDLIESMRHIADGERV